MQSYLKMKRYWWQCNRFPTIAMELEPTNILRHDRRHKYAFTTLHIKIIEEEHILV